MTTPISTHRDDILTPKSALKSQNEINPFDPSNNRGNTAKSNVRFKDQTDNIEQIREEGQNEEENDGENLVQNEEEGREGRDYSNNNGNEEEEEEFDRDEGVMLGEDELEEGMMAEQRRNGAKSAASGKSLG